MLGLINNTLQAETKVKVSKTHLCCASCVSAVEKTLGNLEGVKHTADQDSHSIEIVAASDEAAQKALDALAAAGFYGELDNTKLKFADVAVSKDKVERIELTGIHNCCGACTQAIKKAIGGVDGCTANTVKPRQNSFVVEGKFSGESLVKALLDSGFYVQVKK